MFDSTPSQKVHRSNPFRQLEELNFQRENRKNVPAEVGKTAQFTAQYLGDFPLIRSNADQQAILHTKEGISAGQYHSPRRSLPEQILREKRAKKAEKQMSRFRQLESKKQREKDTSKSRDLKNLRNQTFENAVAPPSTSKPPSPEPWEVLPKLVRNPIPYDPLPKKWWEELPEVVYSELPDTESHDPTYWEESVKDTSDGEYEDLLDSDWEGSESDQTYFQGLEAPMSPTTPPLEEFEEIELNFHEWLSKTRAK